MPNAVKQGPGATAELPFNLFRTVYTNCTCTAVEVNVKGHCGGIFFA
uniref:Uncharacterized protein n=1 Tax=Arundo donax TaxID=35708 RepID=A0A0A9HMA9_ARUDO